MAVTRREISRMSSLRSALSSSYSSGEKAAEVLQQAVLVADSRGYDVVDSQVAEDAALDLYLHGEFFQLYFQTAGQLGLVEDTFADEDGACLVVDVVHQRFGYCL